MVVFGSHDINKKFEENRVIVAAKTIYIHHNWLPFNQNYDADIALIVLKHKVHFNDFVQPACMWESNDTIPVTSGVVVGYGRNEREINENVRVPKKFQIFIHRNEECIAADVRLKAFTSDRTLCGESIYGRFICFGDSGHGFFVKVKERFYLRGIISSSPKGVNNTCTSTHYGIYTNVQRFRHWIENPEDYPGSSLCGVMSTSSGLVQGGVQANREQFPWIAAVLFTNGFNTSGILISHKHVLMHAGGVSFFDETKKSHVAQSVSNFHVLLGTVSNKLIDNQSIAVNPSKVALHPHFRTVGGTQINAIAIVTLVRHVKFDKFIRSACLWTNRDDNLNAIRSIPIYGVGSGLDDSGKHSNIRKYVRMSLQSAEEENEEACKEIYADRSEAFDEAKLFCAKGDETATPCEGDTSLVMKFEDKWYIRAIMLAYRKWTLNGTCVYNRPLLYEDIAQHSQWIIAQMK